MLKNANLLHSLRKAAQLLAAFPSEFQRWFTDGSELQNRPVVSGIERLQDTFKIPWVPKEQRLTLDSGTLRNERGEKVSSHVYSYETLGDELKSLDKRSLRLIVGTGKLRDYPPLSLDGSDQLFDELTLNYEHIKKLRNIVGRTITVHPDARIEGSRILRLSISRNAGISSLVLTDCDIGVLVLPDEGMIDLVISGGWIGELRGNFASLSSIRLIRTSFPTDGLTEGEARALDMHEVPQKLIPTLSRQAFANLLKHAEERGNSEVAHIARGTELAIEHSQSAGFDRFVLSCWWFFGDFSLSPRQPLYHLLAATIGYFFVLVLNGTSLGYEVDPDTWMAALDGSGNGQNVIRAAIGSIQNILSPITMLSPRKLIIPANGWGAFAQFIHSVLTVATVLLIGFSIRRRHKLK